MPALINWTNRAVKKAHLLLYPFPFYLFLCASVRLSSPANHLSSVKQAGYTARKAAKVLLLAAGSTGGVLFPARLPAAGKKFRCRNRTGQEHEIVCLRGAYHRLGAYRNMQRRKR